jgi:hypothetical protein
VKKMHVRPEQQICGGKTDESRQTRFLRHASAGYSVNHYWGSMVIGVGHGSNGYPLSPYLFILCAGRRSFRPKSSDLTKKLVQPIK